MIRTLKTRATIEPQKKTLGLIEKAKEIIYEEGTAMTVRGLYYEFVVRNIIVNTLSSYTQFSWHISNARLSGRLDWEMIIDRTRYSQSNNHYQNPSHLLDVAFNSYFLDSRATQDNYIEVWMEKDALLNSIEPVCRKLDITYLSCRGNCSLTLMHKQAERIKRIEKEGRRSIVIYLGDHDPSGLGMIETARKTLKHFGTNAKVKPIALTMKQIRKYNLPPNPIKERDTRAPAYVAEFGNYSWEIDALKKSILVSLLEKTIAKYTNENKRQSQYKKQKADKIDLGRFIEDYKESLIDFD